MFINFKIQLSPCATALFQELILRYLSAMPPGTLQKSHTPGHRLSFQRCHLFCLPCICKNFSFDYIRTQLAWRGQLNKWFKTGLCNCSVLLTLSEWWICVIHWVLLSPKNKIQFRCLGSNVDSVFRNKGRNEALRNDITKKKEFPMFLTDSKKTGYVTR